MIIQVSLVSISNVEAKHVVCYVTVRIGESIYMRVRKLTSKKGHLVYPLEAHFVRAFMLTYCQLVIRFGKTAFLILSLSLSDSTKCYISIGKIHAIKIDIYTSFNGNLQQTS